jgi:hypothetical protein
MRAAKISARLLALAMLVTALSLLAGPALATTGTGSQNPDLTVTVSLTNSGGGSDGNVDTATVNESITASGALTNNTSRSQSVKVTLTLTGPNGFQASYSVSVFVGAHKTVSVSYDVQVQEYYPTGTYQLTAAASNRHGTSSATASIQIV